MKRLLITCELKYDDVLGDIIDRPFREILKSNIKLFDEIVVICLPNQLERGFFESKNIKGLRYYCVNGYQKNIKDRLVYLFFKNKKTLFDEVFSLEFSHAQIRLPSILGLGLVKLIERNVKKTQYYVAGEWDSSFSSNYKFPLSRIIGIILNYIQDLKVSKSSCVVVAGPKLAKRYKLKYGLDCIVEYATSHNDIHSRQKDFNASNVINIIYMGRLEPLKRVEDAILAIYELRENYKVNFKILGDGVLRTELENLVERKNLNDNVEFLGYVSDNEIIHSLLLSSDFLILPSLSEGSPKVLLEAMSYGVIPFGTESTGSISDILGHGIRGGGFKANSPSSIVAVLRGFIENEDKINKTISSCLKFAAENTIDKQVEKIWERML
ncbi:TPA: glycosyltransferase [Vibrio vulnificus]|nr:glycosyltransferase [Vibrio vulnificus]